MPPKRKNPVTKDLQTEEETEKSTTELKKVKVTKNDSKPDEEPRRSGRNKDVAKKDEPKDAKDKKPSASKTPPKTAPAKLEPKKEDLKNAKASPKPKASPNPKGKNTKEDDEDDEEKKTDAKADTKKQDTKKANASPAAKGKKTEETNDKKAKASPGGKGKKEDADGEKNKAQAAVDAKKAKASPRANGGKGGEGKADKAGETKDDEKMDIEEQSKNEGDDKEDADEETEKEEKKDDKKGKQGKKAEKAKPAAKKEAANKRGASKSKEEDEDEDDEDEEEEKKDAKVVVATKKGTKTLNRNRSLNEGILDSYAGNNRAIPLGDGKFEGSQILISSWNVNGINSVIEKKHLENYMNDFKPDVICLNEHKLTDENCESKGMKWIPQGYTSYFNCCKVKKGYSGVAIVTKVLPISVKFDIGVKKHDTEGRTVTLEFENFYLVSCYVPNAGDQLQGLDYRVKEWDVDFRKYLDGLKEKKHVILCGDLNVAKDDIDIYEVKGKHKLAGFTPQERKSFTEFLDSGYVDTFRHLYPEEKKFSYFGVRFNMRATNRGWRLDYFVVDKEGLHGVKDSTINDKITGSDHLPIELKLDPKFTKS